MRLRSRRGLLRWVSDRVLWWALPILLGAVLLLAGCTGKASPSDDAGGGEVFAQVGGAVFAQAVGEIFLEPVGAAGPDSFAGDAFLIDQSIPSASLPSLTTLSTVPGSPVQLAVLSGATPGLYGGSRSKLVANKEAQLKFLMDNLDKAKAFCAALNADSTLKWSGGTQVTPEQLSAYFAELTPVFLTRDTRVTNHGFRDGKPTARQSVLQAGQMVLVDSHGVPRTRCECGNPLVPAVASPVAPTYTGTKWPTFDPAQVVVVQQAAELVKSFVLLDVETGQTFERPVGSDGTADAARTETTEAATTTTETATTTTTSEVTTTTGQVSTTEAATTTTRSSTTTTTKPSTTTTRSSTTTTTAKPTTTTAKKQGGYSLEVEMFREDSVGDRTMSIGWSAALTVSSSGSVSGSGPGSWHCDGHIYVGQDMVGDFSVDAYFGVKVTGSLQGGSLRLNQALTSYELRNLQIDTSGDYEEGKAAVVGDCGGWIKAAFSSVTLPASSSTVYADLSVGGYYGSATLSPSN